MMITFKLISVLFFAISVNCQCKPSVTTVVGTEKPSQICSGQLIFEDKFDSIDKSKWKFENTLAGGGNWEFQWFPGYDSRNAIIKDGNLHIAPTTTASIYGERFLTHAKVTIPSYQCTLSIHYGCERQGTTTHVINPVRSAKLTTIDSFSFKYGVMEARVKLPAGDWLWPQLWLYPKTSVYGDWPRSGQIDLMRSRGNRQLYSGSTNIGTEQVSSTLHFGPDYQSDSFNTAYFKKNQNPGFDQDFHLYKLEWTPEYLKFFIDNEAIGTVDAGNGFWERGNFQNSGRPNPWTTGSKLAPFDQEFFIITNLSVGGVNGYFNDDDKNRNGTKPWKTNSQRALSDFWEGKDQWLQGWNLGVNDDSHLQVDYVRVWAL